MIRSLLLAAILLAPLAAADPVEPRLIGTSTEGGCVSDGTTTYCEQETTLAGVGLASEGEDVLVVTAHREHDERYERPPEHVRWRDQHWTNQSVHVESPEGERDVRTSACHHELRGTGHDYDINDTCTTGANTEGAPEHGVDTYSFDHAEEDGSSVDRTGATLRVEDLSVTQECVNHNLDSYPFDQHETCWLTVQSADFSHTEQYQHCDRYVWPEYTATCRTGISRDDGTFVGLEQRHDTDRDTADTTTTSFLVVEAAGIEQKVPVPAPLPGL